VDLPVRGDAMSASDRSESISARSSRLHPTMLHAACIIESSRRGTQLVPAILLFDILEIFDVAE
jgi:hypothetical protein